MPLEPLLLFVFLVLLPLLHTIADRRRAASAAPGKQSVEHDDGLRAEPVLPPLHPVQTPLPSSRPLASPLPGVPSPEPLRRADAQPTRSGPERRPSPAQIRLRDAVPRDRERLRRAMLLVEILGPPRSLDKRA